MIEIADNAVPRRYLFRGAIGGGIAVANTVLTGAMARGADTAQRPRIYTRKEWGALPPTQPIPILNHPPDHIIVHHTASPNAAGYSLDHAFALSRSIQQFHMKVRGWEDIGEQLTISRGGYIMEGRFRSLETINTRRLIEGAQCLHHNDHTIGIENEGTYMTADVPDRLWTSLITTCTWLCTVYHLDPSVAILGHRDYNDTDCPGDVLYGRLPELRRQVARGLGTPVRQNAPIMRSGRRSRMTFDHGPAGDADER